MKNILFLIALICAMHIHAQERFDDIGRISIHAYVPESEELPYESHKLLETKLSQIISANGISDNENIVRFILTAKINVISKDIVASILVFGVIIFLNILNCIISSASLKEFVNNGLAKTL